MADVIQAVDQFTERDLRCHPRHFLPPLRPFPAAEGRATTPATRSPDHLVLGIQHTSIISRSKRPVVGPVCGWFTRVAGGKRVFRRHVDRVVGPLVTGFTGSTGASSPAASTAVTLAPAKRSCRRHHKKRRRHRCARHRG